MGDETWHDFLADLTAVRAVVPTVGTEIRADGDGIGTMAGHFSVFNRWYEINSLWEGRFLERVMPGAFERTFDAHFRSNDGRIKVIFNHGMDFQVGDKVLGRIDELREDDTGAYYEVPLFDTSYNRDLLPGLDAGEYGASFAFKVIREEWNDEPDQSDHNPDRLPERSILEVRTFEFGPTPFPASPSATAGIRSMTDDFYDRVRSRNPDQYEQLLARKRELGTPTPVGPANTQDDDPPEGTRRTIPKKAQHKLRFLKANYPQGK